MPKARKTFQFPASKSCCVSCWLCINKHSTHLHSALSEITTNARSSPKVNTTCRGKAPSGTAVASKRKVLASNFSHAGSAAPFGKFVRISELSAAAVRTDSGRSKLKPAPTVDVPFGKETANIIDKPVELGALRCSMLMPDACELPAELLAELPESLVTKVWVVALTING